MIAVAQDPWPTVAAAAQPRGLHRLSLALVWLAMASSGIVFFEPAPVDALLIALIVILPAAGLATLNWPLMVYLLLWLLVTIGGLLGAMSAFDFGVAGKQVFITFYLAVASVMLAAFVQYDPVKHVRLILNGYLLAALVATVAGLVGYFNVAPPLTELLTGFGRARGTFKDPNVYGAFVVPALVYALHLAFTRRTLIAAAALGATGFLLLGALLSFSRGAWSNAAVALILLCYFSFLTSRSSKFRLRITGLLVAAGLCGAAVVGAALQSSQISSLLTERAQLEQSYDGGSNGRFAGHEKAKALIASHPFGIGPLQFGGNYHHEDVHEVYLNVLVGHGWLGGGAYIILVMVTVGIGLAGAFRRVPSQGLMLVALSAYIGTVGEGFIVDTDHWRHFFLLMSLVWGLFLGSAPKTAGPSYGPSRSRQSVSV